MSFGKLFNYPDAPRSTAALIAAHASGLKLEIIETTKPPITTDSLLQDFPMAKVPSFIGADGFKLFECTAVAWYFARQDPDSQLIGKDPKEEGLILQWSSFANTELLPTIMPWINLLTGWVPYNPAEIAGAQKKMDKPLKLLENAVKDKKYLVGERLTLGDLMIVAHLARGYQFVFGEDWRQQWPNIHRYYDTIHHEELYVAVMGEPVYLNKPIEPRSHK